MTASRREFLTAGAAAGLALAARQPIAHGQDVTALAAGPPRVRKDIATLTANSPDVKALTTAVAKMKAGTGIPSCETWANWAAIHGTVNGGFNKCKHNSWFVWPWHRMYVYYFEQIVISLSGDKGFALPYWNWSKNPTIPTLFWAGPLLDPNRSVQQGQSIPQGTSNPITGQAAVSNILNIATFPAFGGTAGGSGQLESGPHNYIHNWIGGDMGTGGSPTDPIFWMHHCNCDRLYSAWINKHPNGLPTNPGWLNTQYNDFCNKGMKVSQTLDSVKQLGYTYDKFTSATAVAMAVRPLPRAAEVEGPSTKERTSVAAATAFVLKPQNAAAATVRRIAAGDVDPRAASIQLELNGIKVPANQNVRVSVFLNAPNPNPDLPDTDPHYVASFTFFHGTQGMGGMKGHGAADGTESRIIDATQTIRRLYGDQVFGNDEELKVQIVAAPLFPDRDPWKGTIQELSPAEVKLIVAAPAE